MKKTLSVLFRNKPLLILVSAFLAFAIGFNIKLSTMVYYFTYNVSHKEFVFLGTVLFFGAALISNLFIPFFLRSGRKQVMIITAALSLISYAPSVYIVFFAAAYFLLAFRFGIFHNAFKYACLGNGCRLCRLCGMENRSPG